MVLQPPAPLALCSEEPKAKTLVLSRLGLLGPELAHDGLRGGKPLANPNVSGAVAASGGWRLSGWLTDWLEPREEIHNE